MYTYSVHVPVLRVYLYTRTGAHSTIDIVIVCGYLVTQGFTAVSVIVTSV